MKVVVSAAGSRVVSRSDAGPTTSTIDSKASSSCGMDQKLTRSLSFWFLTHLEGNVIILLVLLIYLFHITGVDALLILARCVTCDHYKPSGSERVTVIHISSWFQKQENLKVLTGYYQLSEQG